MIKILLIIFRLVKYDSQSISKILRRKSTLIHYHMVWNYKKEFFYNSFHVKHHNSFEYLILHRWAISAPFLIIYKTEQPLLEIAARTIPPSRRTILHPNEWWFWKRWSVHFISHLLLGCKLNQNSLFRSSLLQMRFFCGSSWLHPANKIQDIELQAYHPTCFVHLETKASYL